MQLKLRTYKPWQFSYYTLSSCLPFTLAVIPQPQIYIVIIWMMDNRSGLTKTQGSIGFHPVQFAKQDFAVICKYNEPQLTAVMNGSQNTEFNLYIGFVLLV